MNYIAACRKVWIFLQRIAIYRYFYTHSHTTTINPIQKDKDGKHGWRWYLTRGRRTGCRQIFWNCCKNCWHLHVTSLSLPRVVKDNEIRKRHRYVGASSKNINPLMGLGSFWTSILHDFESTLSYILKTRYNLRIEEPLQQSCRTKSISTWKQSR